MARQVRKSGSIQFSILRTVIRPRDLFRLADFDSTAPVTDLGVPTHFWLLHDFLYVCPGPDSATHADFFAPAVSPVLPSM